MTYDIIAKDGTVLVTVSDQGITEQLSMNQEPPSGCLLVQKGKQDVLGEINLGKMLSNLHDCVDLLQITYNAVDGFAVQVQVQELSNRFIDAMNNSNQTALDFQLSAQDALEACIYAYSLLMEGQVESALGLLAETKNTAAKMVQRSDKLVNTYQELTDYTNTVLKRVMDERSNDEKKREETKAMIGELEGSIQAMEALKKSLAADIQAMDNEYQQLQQREIQAEKRAFGMQLASLILGSLGSILGIPGKAMGSSGDERDAAERETQDVAGKISTKDQATRAYAENIGRQTAIEAERKKLDQRIQRIDEVLDGELYQGGAHNGDLDPSDPDAKKTDEELRKEKQSKVDQKAKLDQELDGLKGKQSALENTLKGLGVAVDEVSKQTRSMAQDIQTRADSLAARAEEVRKNRDKLKDLERENLVELAKNTAKMKNMVMDANSLESAIQCLVIAIGCLRKVLAYLQEIKLFWMNVETFCSNLASNQNLASLIASQKNYPPATCTAFFKNRIFVTGYLGLMAKWKALNVIFGEYQTELMKVSQRMGKAMEQPLSPDRKIQWKLASDMAGALNDKLNKEVTAL